MSEVVKSGINEEEGKWLMKWIESDITEEGAIMIGEVLKSNSTLTSLNLGCDAKEDKVGNKKSNLNEQISR